MPIAEILSQGEEIVGGQTTDSNAAWLSRRLRDLGCDVRRHTAVGDRLDDLVHVMGEIANRAEVCIGSGGLGPTSDDLTAAAVAEAFDMPLQFDAVAWQQIETFFAQRQRPLPAINRKQAWLPRGAQRLDNTCGTAPGFALQTGTCRWFFLPGVPFEMRAMFESAVVPLLRRHYTLVPQRTVVLHTFGLGESAIAEALQTLPLPPGVRLGYRARHSEVQVKLTFPPDEAATQRERLVASFAAQLGDAVFAITEEETAEKHPGELASVVHTLIAARGWSLAAWETWSKGRFTSYCASYPWLVASGYGARFDPVPARSRGETTRLQDDIAATAIQCAHSLREQYHCDIGLAQLHTPASDDAAAGVILHTALVFPGSRTYQEKRRVHGTLARQAEHAALWMLDSLRRALRDTA